MVDWCPVWPDLSEHKIHQCRLLPAQKVPEMLGEMRVRGYRTVSFTAAVVSTGIVIGAVHIAGPVTHRAHGVLVPDTQHKLELRWS